MARNSADVTAGARPGSDRVITFGPRNLLAIIVLAAALVLGTALLSQFWGGLAPCEICLYERWPYDAVLLIGIVALAAGRSVKRPALLVIGLIFAASSVLAFYHVGVEQHWFAGPSACTGGGGADTVEAMTAQLLGTQVVMCDQPAWTFHGLSLAGLNLMASLVLLGLSLAALAQPRSPHLEIP